MSALTLTDVSAGWGRCPVLHDLTLQCAPGEILGLMGPNGAGKSTLMRVLAGDTPLLAGSVHFMGRELSTWPVAERARHLACLPQASGLTFPFTVQEVVALGRLPYQAGRECDAQAVASALKATDTRQLSARLYPHLSGGEQQRVQLARVLCQLEGEQVGAALSEQLLLLDEPTAALDLRHRQDLMKVLGERRARGCTILIALHDINLLSSLCDRILVLDAGRAIALDTPERVLQPSLLQRLYATDFLVQAHPRSGRPLVFPR
jgi:iron complex transport system ATP-binding protein